MGCQNNFLFLQSMKTENRIDKSIDELLSRIEQECNEEPDTLLSVHPENYTTEHLFQLRGRWQQRNRSFKKSYSIVFGMGVLSPIFFSFGMLGFVYYPILGVIFLPLSISTFICFIFGIFIISTRYKSSGYQESILQKIDGELKRRGQFVE